MKCYKLKYFHIVFCLIKYYYNVTISISFNSFLLNSFIFYTDIHLRKLMDNICYFQKKKKKKALTTIAMVEISTVLFRVDLSSELSLIFIYFLS